MMLHSCVVRNQCSEANYCLHLHCLKTSVTLQNYITYSWPTLHYTTWNYYFVEILYTTLASEQSILTLAPTFQRKLLPPSPHGKGTSRHRNKRTGARAVSEAVGDRQENFLRWEEAAPSRTFLQETPIVALKVSLFKVFTKRSSFRCRPWQIIFCKTVFTVPWVTPAWNTQLPIPTGHLPTPQPVSLLHWRQSYKVQHGSNHLPDHVVQ
jgi:hypothetical protein